METSARRLGGTTTAAKPLATKVKPVHYFVWPCCIYLRPCGRKTVIQLRFMLNVFIVIDAACIHDLLPNGFAIGTRSHFMVIRTRSRGLYRIPLLLTATCAVLLLNRSRVQIVPVEGVSLVSLAVDPPCLSQRVSSSFWTPTEPAGWCCDVRCTST